MVKKVNFWALKACFFVTVLLPNKTKIHQIAKKYFQYQFMCILCHSWQYLFLRICLGFRQRIPYREKPGTNSVLWQDISYQYFGGSPVKCSGVQVKQKYAVRTKNVKL